MTVKLYPKWKEALIRGDANATLVGVRVALINRAIYTYDDAHRFLTNGNAASAIIGTPQDIANPTYTNGIFGANPTQNFSNVPSGPTVGAIIVYIWTGSNATSRLVFYSDEAQGLPIVPDGGDETITWDGAGIFAL